MDLFAKPARSRRFSGLIPVILSWWLMAVPGHVFAICGLDAALRELIRSVDQLESKRALSTRIQRSGICSACHLARFGGPRNEFGNAINTLLTTDDREALVRQREVGRRMKDILADPSLPNSPTFGELLQMGRFPANSNNFGRLQQESWAVLMRTEERLTPPAEAMSALRASAPYREVKVV